MRSPNVTVWLARCGFIMLLAFVLFALPAIGFDSLRNVDGGLVLLGATSAATFAGYVAFAGSRRNDIALALIGLILIQEFARRLLDWRPDLDRAAVELGAVLAVHLSSHLETLRSSIRDPGKSRRPERRSGRPAPSGHVRRAVEAWIVE